MKKKASIVWATMAVAGAASAQSTVTLFGVLDAGVSNYQTRSTWYNNTALPSAPAFGAPNYTKMSQTALSSGGTTPTRLGFRGTEDLGGGLAAGFWLEGGLSNDTGGGQGPNGNFVFNRRSTLSLSGSFGEIRLGRDLVPSYWNDTTFDPYGTVGVGANLIASIDGNLATLRGPGSAIAASDNDVRAGNGIGYFLPPDLGGFYGQVMYTFHENVKRNDLPGSPSKRGQYAGGRFGYANGPLDVALSYGVSTAADATGATSTGLPTGANFDNKLKKSSLGASYDFGVAKVMGDIAHVVDQRDTSTPSALFGGVNSTLRDTYDGVMIGAVVPVGVGQIKASFARVKFDNGLKATLPFATTNLDASLNKISLGYVHNLSKRTALYATVARIRIKNGENLPVGLSPGTGGAAAYVSTGAGQFGYAPRSATGYDFGIRHAF